MKSSGESAVSRTMRRSAGVRRRRRGRVSGNDIVEESSLTLARAPRHDQRVDQRLGRRRRGDARVGQAGRARGPSAVVGPMTATAFPASAVELQRARNARSADGLAKVAASNGRSGRQVGDRTVSETATTSTTNPRASSCCPEVLAAAHRLRKQNARAGRRRRERRHQPLLPLLVVGGIFPRSTPRTRGRPRVPGPTAAIRALARACHAGAQRRARPHAKSHRRRAGQHHPAVVRRAHDGPGRTRPSWGAARPGSSDRRRVPPPRRAAPRPAKRPGRSGA